MRKLLLLVVVLASPPAFASTLFDDDQVLEVTLSGPLSSVIADKRKREQRRFTLSIGDDAYNVNVRVRGNSRVQACPFPPLRLNFKKGELKERRWTAKTSSSSLRTAGMAAQARRTAS